MVIAAMKLTRDIARDADARGSGAGVGHGAGYVRGTVIKCRNGGSSRGSAAGVVGVADGQVLNEA